MTPHLTDKQLKTRAKYAANKSVFDNMNAPKDIYCECSDGTWVRRVWTNPCGTWGWDKWEKLS